MSIWSTENEGGRPYVRLYRTVGMSTEVVVQVSRSVLPATSHMYISPRKVPVVGMSHLGPNPTYHCLGLWNVISQLCGVRKLCETTHEDRTRP